ncbi:transglutaminase family protein [Luteolibacter algae]|uniref:Transglutaminase family protein n=1 Tax=Luteolibacter algae TaxID=454151 RepID=A0ABW5D523_9BACT
MNVSPPDIRELTALLKLLDDETPEVRSGVSGRLAEVGGDFSEILPDVARNLKETEKKILADILRPVRRKVLREEWLTPRFGSAALGDDWELFESHLRLLSDFLHDGVSLRQPLSDALDLLAEEIQEAHPLPPTANDIRVFLFEEGRLKGNKSHYYDPHNTDLAWCIAEGKSNPIGLGVIYMLLGQRLNVEIEGISFPGHFLCRIYEESHPLVVDCFDDGRVHSQEILTDPSNDLSREQRQMLRQSADLGMILLRLLNNLIDSFQRMKLVEDAELITEMRDSMQRERR